MRLPFDAGAPKTLALTIGAAAALERGRLDKSIKFVQAGLRHDPDSAPLKKQYDGLKSLKRKTEAVDKHLKKGYSVKALDAAARAAKESDIPNFKGSFLGRFPLVSAEFWTSDHLSERPRSVGACSGTRARGALTLKRR
jgi:hypothetical protein